jgi:RNA polymerase-binding transcription factor DksA
MMKQNSGRRVPSATTSAVVEASTRRPSVNGKWAWHYRILLALRERRVGECLQRLEEASQLLEPHSMDIADSATDEFDHDLALSRLSTTQDALYEIDEALVRILDGSYGVCEETGQPIPAARLKAIPWTRFAREAEERLERQRVPG